MQKASDNTNLTEEDKKAIADGANWLSNWITERYNQGYLSQDEYQSSIEVLQDVNIYVTNKGYQGMFEALDKGELHLKNDVIHTYSALYDFDQGALDATGFSEEKIKLLQDLEIEFYVSNMSDEQKAIAYLKAQYPATKDGILGFHYKNISEPAIFVDVQAINNSSSSPSLESVIVHELTHNLHLESQEEAIKQALYGHSIAKDVVAPIELATAPQISPQIVVQHNTLGDKNVDSSKVEVNDWKVSSDSNQGVQLKDGINFNQYGDRPCEVYARLMQLRHDFGLKPNESFSLEQINEIEERAKIAKAKLKAGENTEKVDIDLNIVSRYRNGTVQDMLNYTAEEKTGIINAFKVQKWQSNRDLVQAKSSLQSESPSQDKPSMKKPQNYMIIFASERNMT